MPSLEVSWSCSSWSSDFPVTVSSTKPKFKKFRSEYKNVDPWALVGSLCDKSNNLPGGLIGACVIQASRLASYVV